MMQNNYILYILLYMYYIYTIFQKSCLEVCGMDPELPAEVIDAVFKALVGL